MSAELLPPPIVWMLEMLALAALLTVAVKSPPNGRASRILICAAGLTLLLTILSQLIWDLGHTWDLPSTIGKFVTEFMTADLPLFAAAVAFLIMVRKARLRVAAATSFGVGLVAISPMLIVGLVLSCSLTGDCV